MGIERTFEQEAKSDFLNLLNTASGYGRADAVERHIKENSEYLGVSLDTVEQGVYEKMVGLRFYDISDVEQILKTNAEAVPYGSVVASTVGNGFKDWMSLTVDDTMNIESSRGTAMIEAPSRYGSGNSFGISAIDVPEADYTLEFEVKPVSDTDMGITWGNSGYSARLQLATQEKTAPLGAEQIIVSPDVWTKFSISADESSFCTTYTEDGGEEQSLTFELSKASDQKGFWAELNEGKAYIRNVRMYTGTSQPISVGTVCIEKEEASVPVYEGKDNLVINTYTQSPVSPVAEGDEQYIVTNFDARNTVKGMPLAIHISGGAGAETAQNYVGTVSILSTDEITDEWYSYKIISKQIYGTRDMKTVGVYRKKTGTTEAYETVEFLNNNGGRISSGIGNIRFGYRTADEKYAYSGATLTDTVWEVANARVIANGAAAMGYLTEGGGSYTAELDFTAPDITAAPTLGVYSDGRMIGVDSEIASNGEGNLMLTVPFDVTAVSNPAAKLFIWGASPGAPYSESVQTQ